MAFLLWQLCFSTPGYPLEFLKMLSPFCIVNLMRRAMASFNFSSVASILPWTCLHQLLPSLCLLDQSENLSGHFLFFLGHFCHLLLGTVFLRDLFCFLCAYPNFLLAGYFRHYTAAILDIFLRAGSGRVSW